METEASDFVLARYRYLKALKMIYLLDGAGEKW